MHVGVLVVPSRIPDKQDPSLKGRAPMSAICALCDSGSKRDVRLQPATKVTSSSVTR